MFFFNDTATTEIYTLSLHDALPISVQSEAEEMLRRTLLLAQRTADETVASAQADAERMTNEARERAETLLRQAQEDRKSTRLNSSHANISYAVFCLKK